MKSGPKVRSGQAGVGSNIGLGSHIWSLFAPIHMQSLPKSKIDQIEVGSNIAQNHSLYLVIICPNSHAKLTKFGFI